MQLRDGVLSVPETGYDQTITPVNEPPRFLPDIADCIDSLYPSLWPLNSFIHENPELGFQEHRAHDALTAFVRSHPGWQVTTSAYGMATAWEAVYDTGRSGPVVAFNAEMGA
jgi:metal-dependent amidase/aminoacylase/carboxypeptidase family protein